MIAKISNEKVNTERRMGKATCYTEGTPIRPAPDFLGKTWHARRQWHNIFKVMKGKNLQHRILYLARLSFKYDGEIKSFTDSKS